MDFFLWGVLKDMVYKEKPQTIPDIRRVILLTKLPQLIWNYAKRFIAVSLHDWFPVLNTTGNNSNSLNDLFEHCCNFTSFLLIIVSSLLYS